MVVKYNVLQMVENVKGVEKSERKFVLNKSSVALMMLS